MPLPATIDCVRYLSIAIPRRPYLPIAILSTAIDCASYSSIAIVSDNHVALTERLRQTATRTAFIWGRELDYVTDNTSWASQETDKVSESFGATASELGLEKQKHWPRHNTAHAKMNIRKSLSLFVRLHLAEISTKTQKHQRPHTNCYESRRSRPRWNLVDEMLNTQGEHRYNFPCPILHPSRGIPKTRFHM